MPADNEPESTRWYPSKVDWWLAVLLALAPVAMLAALITSVASGEGELAAVVANLVVAAVYLGLVLPMRYGISDETLTIRFGLVRQRIPLDRITEVRPTHNPLSSPALSLDRLAIRHGHGLTGRTLISPADREAFLGDLAARAGLRREAKVLTR